jgi:hypothetical protein
MSSSNEHERRYVYAYPHISPGDYLIWRDGGTGEPRCVQMLSRGQLGQYYASFIDNPAATLAVGSGELFRETF